MFVIQLKPDFSSAWPFPFLQHHSQLIVATRHHFLLSLHTTNTISSLAITWINKSHYHCILQLSRITEMPPVIQLQHACNLAHCSAKSITWAAAQPSLTSTTSANQPKPTGAHLSSPAIPAPIPPAVSAQPESLTAILHSTPVVPICYHHLPPAPRFRPNPFSFVSVRCTIIHEQHL